ncbi:MAG: ATP-binding protein [Bradymonadales bacterium]|nr:ATP-binding protein [Bradymonadales bacterium]
MVAQGELHGELFPSNEAYLQWELNRLERRLTAYLRAKEDPGAIPAYLELAAELDQTRLEGIRIRRDTLEAGIDIPFDRISVRYSLAARDEEILMCCVAPHLSAAIRDLLIHAQGNLLKTYLEVGFVSELIHPTGTLLTGRIWFEGGHRLVTAGLLQVEEPAGSSGPMSLLSHSVSTPHYVAAAVLGQSMVDERVASFCEIVEPAIELYDVILSPDTRRIVQEFIRGFYRRNEVLDTHQDSWTLLISGPRGSGKSTLAEGLAKALHHKLFVMHLHRLARQYERAPLIRHAVRNAQFNDAVLLLNRPEDLLVIDPGLQGALESLIDEYQGVTILEPRQAEKLDPSFESLINFFVELDWPDQESREQLWESLLPADAALHPDVHIGQIASSFELAGAQIKGAIGWARQRAMARGDKLELTANDLVFGAKSQILTKLEAYADTLRIKMSMDDIVLPENTMDLVKEFLDACHQRNFVMNDWGFSKRLTTGKGLVALFTGEPGTGKTLCAEILANELGLRLYIVSIPKIVSKWVGETEKNIREIFSHARAQNSMLLFDEADALFTTRVKVERAQDHYQNMEVNMLLQEIERFEGIVILTTNLETNIDRAFQRRILFTIDFPIPEKEQRNKIWRKLLPVQAPIEGEIDVELLAEWFELTGGQIKNAVIRAAYRCAAAGHGLTQTDLEKSAHQQAKEAGKLARPLEELHM